MSVKSVSKAVKVATREDTLNRAAQEIGRSFARASQKAPEDSVSSAALNHLTEYAEMWQEIRTGLETHAINSGFCEGVSDALRLAGKGTKQHTGSDTPITAEERALLNNYRALALWDQTFYFMILQSLAGGRLTEETDGYSWKKICAVSDLPQSRKAVRHG